MGVAGCFGSVAMLEDVHPYCPASSIRHFDRHIWFYLLAVESVPTDLQAAQYRPQVLLTEAVSRAWRTP